MFTNIAYNRLDFVCLRKTLGLVPRNYHGLDNVSHAGTVRVNVSNDSKFSIMVQTYANVANSCTILSYPKCGTTDEGCFSKHKNIFRRIKKRLRNVFEHVIRINRETDESHGETFGKLGEAHAYGENCVCVVTRRKPLGNYFD